MKYEYIRSVVVKIKEGSGAYEEIGKREGNIIPIVNLALHLITEDGIIKEASLALGSVAPTPVRAVNAERALTGKSVQEALRCNGQELFRDISPITDFRASKEYRYAMSVALLRRALRRLGE